jgi:endonuclease III
VGPNDPYEMIVFVNCGYPATDVSCSKGFEALKREVGLKPESLLDAPKAKLAKLMQLGGIVPELRAEKLKEIARMVKDQFGKDLLAALKKCTLEEKKTDRQGDSRREECTPEVSRNWRAGCGENFAVCETGAGCGRALRVR